MLTSGHIETFPARNDAAKAVSRTQDSGESIDGEERSTESVHCVSTSSKLTVCSSFPVFEGQELTFHLTNIDVGHQRETNSDEKTTRRKFTFMRPYLMIKGCLVLPWQIRDHIFDYKGRYVLVPDRPSDDKVLYSPKGVITSGEHPEDNIKHSTRYGSKYRSKKPETKKAVNVVSGNSIEAEHVPDEHSGETLIRDITIAIAIMTELLSSIQRNTQEHRDWIQSRVCQ